jgi:hypothetical protein
MIRFEDPRTGAKYSSDFNDPYVYFECGHSTNEFSIVMGLYHRVDAGLGVGLCALCSKEAQVKALTQRREENAKRRSDTIAESVSASLEKGLQPLEGSREAVEFAEKKRSHLFDMIARERKRDTEIYTPKEKEILQEIFDVITSELKERAEASWWADPLLNLSSMLRETFTRLQEADPERFKVGSCGHKRGALPLGPLQKLLCTKCAASTYREIPKCSTVARQIKAGPPIIDGPEQAVLRAEKLRERLLYYLVTIETKRSTTAHITQFICKLAICQTNARWWLDQPTDREDAKDPRDALYLQLREYTQLMFPNPKKEEKPANPLVRLTGSEKQVAWAEKIRGEFFAVLEQYLQPGYMVHEEKIRGQMIQRALVEKQSAAWWIDSTSRQNPYAHMRELLSAINLPEELGL